MIYRPLLAVLLLLPSCATAPSAGSTVQGVDLPRLVLALDRVDATLRHLLEAAKAAGAPADPQADRIVAQVLDLVAATKRISAQSDFNADAVLSGTEWLTWLGSIGFDVAARIAALQQEQPKQP